MAKEGNLISVSFTEDELTRMDDALRTIEGILNGKTVNLTPDERRQFGRIAEQNKLFVNKTLEFMKEYPQYVPQFVDVDEFVADYTAREVIESRLNRLARCTEQLSDTKTLLDNDNYTNALMYYRNIRYLSGENVPGITTIAQELGQFFSRSKFRKA